MRNRHGSLRRSPIRSPGAAGELSEEKEDELKQGPRFERDMAWSWAGATPFSLPAMAWWSLQPNLAGCATGEVSFTLSLQRALHLELHCGSHNKCLRTTAMDDFQKRRQHAAQIGPEAGATRHFAARCVTCSAGSLPPRIAGFRDEFCAAC